MDMYPGWAKMAEQQIRAYKEQYGLIGRLCGPATYTVREIILIQTMPW